jgi:signal transduction histidine kinase
VGADSRASDVSGPHDERTQRLAAAVRESAVRAADEVGGGIALVFATAPTDAEAPAAPRLRAAAGFPSAQAAREAAGRLEPRVLEALEAHGVASFASDPSLGARGAAGLLMFPLAWGERMHGVLAVGLPSPLDAGRQQVLSTLAETLALRFDHADVERRWNELHEESSRGGEARDEKNEEILKLSEALFAQDIELLRTNERLGKVEKLKHDFIERMSRELRTPLNSIIEAIISVLTSEHDALSDAGKRSLRLALDDGTGFLRTLQNILDLWRVKQGELPVEIQDVNFRETVDEAIFSVQDQLSGKPVVIEQQIDERFPKIRTDLTKINQILFLLLENAVKFTPAGKVVIRARVEADRLHCEIRDTGIGIAADDRPYIFDEFFQVDVPASQRYQGAGLGLALVRDLIVLLSGEIAVSSEIGEGSSFSFSLPVQVSG